MTLQGTDLVEKNRESDADTGNRTPRPFVTSGIGRRISELTERGFTKRQLAEMAGLSESQLHRVISGESQPRLEAIAGISIGTRSSLDWLAFGFGHADGVGEEPARYEAEFVRVPRYEVTASAGHGAVVNGELPRDALAFRRDWLEREGISASSLAAIEVSGDSMEPTISDGDSVLVDLSSNNPARPGVYVMRADGLLVVKRLQLEPSGRVVVQSDNQSYRTMTGEPGDVDVVGRVVWVGRRL